MKNSLRNLSLLVIGVMTLGLFAGCGSPEHRRTAGEYLDDQSVNARVKANLLQDDEVAGFDVSTTTYDGVVQLSGFVATAEQRDRAGEIASQVDGVQEVINNVTVNPRAAEFGARDADQEPAEVQQPPRQ
jgi:hyperosmotically inducible periplasmic protein